MEKKGKSHRGISKKTKHALHPRSFKILKPTLVNMEHSFADTCLIASNIIGNAVRENFEGNAVSHLWKLKLESKTKL